MRNDLHKLKAMKGDGLNNRDYSNTAIVLVLIGIFALAAIALTFWVE